MSHSQRQQSPVERLFEQRRTALTELAPLREMLTAASVLCDDGLKQLTSLDIKCEVARVDQGSLGEALLRRPSAVLASYDLPAWSAPVCIGLAPSLLFSSVDAMFGGNGMAKPPASPRRLTEIERQVAQRIADAILSSFRTGLGKVMEITPYGSSTAWENAEALIEDTRIPTLGILLKISPIADTVIVTLPAALVEDARGRLQNLSAEQVPANDPSWSRAFQRSVMSSEVEIVASADGPQMTLGHVAALDVGSVIELDPETLQQVMLSREEHPIFEGRLGQSKGLFTVMLEQLAVKRNGARGA